MSDIRQIPLFPDQPQTPEDINRHTRLQDTIALFLKYLRQEGKSDHTITAFRSDLSLLGENTEADTPIGQYTTTRLNQFLEWLENGRGVPCSRKSYARRVTTLKVYFKWLHAIGAIPHDPAKAILQRSGPAPLSYALNPAEIKQAIITACQMQKGDQQDYRPEILFRLLLDTGIKKSETSRLIFQDIDRLNPQRPFLMVRYKVRNIYKERKIDLDPEWLKLLDLYREQYQPKDTIFNCTARNLEYILTDIGEQADIGTKLSFEMMRWSCAVRDYRSGVDDQFIREKLGLSEASWHETSKKIKKLAESQLKDEV